MESLKKKVCVTGIELIPEQVDDFCRTAEEDGWKVIKKIKREDGWIGVYISKPKEEYDKQKVGIHGD